MMEGMEQPIPPTLLFAVRAALRPRGPLDAVRVVALGGLAATQVLDRLAPEVRGALSEHDNPVVRRREALHHVACALDELIQQGLAKRGRAQLKNAMVDVYRLRLRGG